MKKSLFLAASLLAAVIGVNAQQNVQISAGETLTQAMLDSWADAGSVTVTFETGTYTLYESDATGTVSLRIPDGLALTFVGGGKMEETVLKAQSGFLLGGTHAYVRFENLTFSDDGCQYLFNQGQVATVENDITFKGCYFMDFARSILRCKDQQEVSINQLSFDDCIISNQGTDGYATVVLDAKEVSCTTLDFNNVTFNGLANGLVALNNSSRGLCSNDAISFSNCTFYNCIGSGRYIVDAGSTSQGPTVTFNNCILGKTYTSTLGTDGDGAPAWTNTSKGIRTQEVIVNDTYITTDGIFSANKIAGCTEYAGSSEDLFEDPESGNFKIKDTAFEGFDKTGDQRWYSEASEVVHPNSIAETVAGKTVIATEYYTVAGVKVPEPVKGINLIRNIMENGSVEMTKAYIR